jgi:restriction system protein
MAISGFQTLMRPALQTLADGGELRVQTIRDVLAREFGLTEAELEQRLRSGTTKTYANRVAWTLSHMKGAGLIESPRAASTGSPNAAARRCPRPATAIASISAASVSS